MCKTAGTEIIIIYYYKIQTIDHKFNQYSPIKKNNGF